MIFLGKSGKPPINAMGAGNRAEFLCTDTPVEETYPENFVEKLKLFLFLGHFEKHRAIFLQGFVKLQITVKIAMGAGHEL